MQRGRMPYTGGYDRVNLNTSNMDNPYALVLEYKSYWFSMLVVFTLKDIMVLSIFVFDGCKERKNGALNDVDFYIYHSLKKLIHISHIW